MFKPSPPPPPSPSLWPPPPPAPSPPSPPPRRAATYRASGPGLTPEPDHRGAAPGLMGRFLDGALGRLGAGRRQGPVGGSLGRCSPLDLRRVKVCLPGPQELAALPGLSSGDAELVLSHPLPPQEPQAPLLPALRWDLAVVPRPEEQPQRVSLGQESVKAGGQALAQGRWGTRRWAASSASAELAG